MRVLFVKIFLLFWVSSAVLIGIAYVVLMLTSDQRRERQVESLYGHAEQAVQAHVEGGADGLARFLDRLEHGEGIRAYLLDSTGEPLGRPPPRRLLRRLDRFPQKIALGSEERPFASVHAMLVRAAGGGEYRFIAILRQGPWLFHDLGRRGYGLLVLVLATAVASLVIAWLLTRPLAQLSDVTRRFADGELGARPPPALERRADVIGRLAREFARMAARIAGLITAQNQLVRDVSHELRSPLARLQVAAALAARRLGENDADLKRIEDEIQRLDMLLRQLIDLHAVDDEAAPPEHEPADLGALLAEVAEDARYEFRAEDKDIDVEAGGPAVVAGDPRRLHSALDNVIRNAMRYTVPGTMVVARLTRSGGDAVIEVDDLGPGVPDEHLEHIFEPFVRLDETRSPGTGNHGLGLAIAAAVVRKGGGTIGAANRPGGGLRMTIRLPLWHEAEADA